MTSEHRFERKLCAMVGGFSLHAAIAIPRHQRNRLERLIRYTARPSISTERMSLTKTGDIKYELKKENAPIEIIPIN